MGLFDRVEKGLERAVNGAFAKAFRAELQPVEIAAAIRRRMDDRAALLDRGRTMVPNIYTVELSPGDYDRLADFETSLTEELVAAAQEHAETQRYLPSGPLAVQFAESETLKTGTFRVTSANSRRSPQPSARSMPSRRSTPADPYAEPESPAQVPKNYYATVDLAEESTGNVVECLEDNNAAVTETVACPVAG